MRNWSFPREPLSSSSWRPRPDGASGERYGPWRTAANDSAHLDGWIVAGSFANGWFTSGFWRFRSRIDGELSSGFGPIFTSGPTSSLDPWPVVTPLRDGGAPRSLVLVHPTKMTIGRKNHALFIRP